MDLSLYTQVIEETLQKINFDTGSVMNKAEEQVKSFLEENTSITDNEKAAIYANFLTQTTTNVVTQVLTAATQIALQAPVNEQQIASMQGELSIEQAQSDKDLMVKDSDIAVNTQKVLSMQAEDEARKNEVAAKVAKAKVEIEQLIPSQIAINEKQLQVEDKKLTLMDSEIESEAKKLVLMDKELALKERQIEIEGAKKPLIEAQTKVENAKSSLVNSQSMTEIEKMNQIAAETTYRYEQTNAIGKAFEVNERIEDKRNETHIEVATIQASGI
ncbi:hypothetical protein [Hydrogenimonas sp.]